MSYLNRCPPPVPPSTAEVRNFTPMPTWEGLTNLSSNMANEIGSASNETRNRR